MRAALEQASLAADSSEVPIGAVVVCGREIVAVAHNEVEGKNCATKHAELLAIERASKVLGQWRLTECSLYVTLEPCAMCLGAIALSRIKELYFGCYDSRLGAAGSLFNLTEYPGFSPNLKIYPEVLKDECTALLKDFFETKR